MNSLENTPSPDAVLYRQIGELRDRIERLEADKRRLRMEVDAAHGLLDYCEISDSRSNTGIEVPLTLHERISAIRGEVRRLEHQRDNDWHTSKLLVQEVTLQKCLRDAAEREVAILKSALRSCEFSLSRRKEGRPIKSKHLAARKIEVILRPQ